MESHVDPYDLTAVSREIKDLLSKVFSRIASGNNPPQSQDMVELISAAEKAASSSRDQIEVHKAKVDLWRSWWTQQLLSDERSLLCFKKFLDSVINAVICFNLVPSMGAEYELLDSTRVVIQDTLDEVKWREQASKAIHERVVRYRVPALVKLVFYFALFEGALNVLQKAIKECHVHQRMVANVYRYLQEGKRVCAELENQEWKPSTPFCRTKTGNILQEWKFLQRKSTSLLNQAVCLNFLAEGFKEAHKLPATPPPSNVDLAKKAYMCFEDAWASAKVSGVSALEAQAAANLGNVLKRCGFPVEARSCYKDCVLLAGNIAGAISSAWYQEAQNAIESEHDQKRLKKDKGGDEGEETLKKYERALNALGEHNTSKEDLVNYLTKEYYSGTLEGSFDDKMGELRTYFNREDVPTDVRYFNSEILKKINSWHSLT